MNEQPKYFPNQDAGTYDQEDSYDQDAYESSSSNRRSSYREIAGNEQLTGPQAALECLREYGRERPETVAMFALGLGFLLGWKLRLW